MRKIEINISGVDDAWTVHMNDREIAVLCGTLDRFTAACSARRTKQAEKARVKAAELAEAAGLTVEELTATNDVL